MPSPPSTSNLMARTEPERVLVLEDDPGVLRVFGRALERAGFSVELADDGRDAAHKLLEENGFCAVVADIAVPGMSGIELLRCARVHDLDTPVLLVTGAADLRTAQEAVSHGAFQLLTKPVSASLLVAEVRRASKLNTLARTRRHAMRLLEAEEEEASRLASTDEAFSRAMGTLWMAYQPIVRADGTVFGYEALMRCEEPALRSPLAVLDAAARLGRLRELGRLCRLRSTESFAAAPPDVSLFVNLHARDIMDDALSSLSAPLSGIADRVVLEITERATLSDLSEMHARLGELREMGFRLAIDDLGAGYAGLSSFTLLEPEFVKLDMSLVRDIEKSNIKRKLVRLIAATCRDLGISVVAEGIETVAERDTLLELGCPLLQGYLIAKPGRPFPAIHW